MHAVGKGVRDIGRCVSPVYSKILEFFNIINEAVSLMQKRGWLEIIASILSSLEERRLKKTHIINNAKIDSRTASKYISFLLGRRLIAKSSDDSLFEITEKGKILLKSYSNILEMLQIETLSEDDPIVEYIM